MELQSSSNIIYHSNTKRNILSFGCNNLSGDTVILLKNNMHITLKDASKLNIIDIITFDINTLQLIPTKGKVIKSNVITLNQSTFSGESTNSKLFYNQYTQFLTNINNTLIYYSLESHPVLKLKVCNNVIEKFSYSFPNTSEDEFVQPGYTIKLLSGSNFLTSGNVASDQFFIIKSN